VREHAIQPGQSRHPAGEPPRGALAAKLITPVKPIGHQHEPRDLKTTAGDEL